MTERLAAVALTGREQGESLVATVFQGRLDMPGVLQAVVLFAVACVVVYGCIAAIKAKPAGDNHGHGGHGGHGHH